jgi:hypothetical protein
MHCVPIPAHHGGYGLLASISETAEPGSIASFLMAEMTLQACRRADGRSE